MAEAVWLTSACERAALKVKAATSDQDQQVARDAHTALQARINQIAQTRATQLADAARAARAASEHQLAINIRMDRKNQ